MHSGLAPPTRSLVSLKWATGAAAICWAAWAVKASRSAAARPAVETTVPAETTYPTRSDRAWAVLQPTGTGPGTGSRWWRARWPRTAPGR